MAKIFTVSGPRGVGKSSVIDDLRTQAGIMPIVPYTTRSARDYEVEGVDYHFVTDEEFDTIRRLQGMFDVLTLGDNKYGTPMEEFNNVASTPDGVPENIRTINLAAASAISLRSELGTSVVKSVFILPQSWQDIEQQMRDHGVPEEEILARRSAEPTSLTMLPDFDRIVINRYGDRESTFREISSFINASAGVEIVPVAK